ncbi:MAG: hypothetical protein H6873_06685 [Hyphomicrobiaceae bacterium]|nr:hypothetical protein [Hyphomicrobiaceae bacterium]
MKRKRPIGAPPNQAAKALREGKFRIRIVKGKTAYSRKSKYIKKGVDVEDALPFCRSPKGENASIEIMRN